MKKTLEFDRFLTEKNRETLTVTVYGKAYEVPARVPAIAPLMMARAEKLADQSSRNDAYARMIFGAADALFGEASMNEICSHGMSVDELSLLVQKTFGLINGTEEEEEEVVEIGDEDSRSILPGDSAKKSI